MITYKKQAIPNGYRIIQSDGLDYIPIFETSPPLEEEILDKIINALNFVYEKGFDDGWEERIYSERWE